MELPIVKQQRCRVLAINIYMKSLAGLVWPKILNYFGGIFVLRYYDRLYQILFEGQLKSLQWLQLDSNPHPLGWEFESSCSRFECSCSYLNFRFRACFEQGVPWHSGKYREYKNIKLKSFQLEDQNENRLIFYQSNKKDNRGLCIADILFEQSQQQRKSEPSFCIFVVHLTGIFPSDIK